MASFNLRAEEFEPGDVWTAMVQRPWGTSHLWGDRKVRTVSLEPTNVPTIVFVDVEDVEDGLRYRVQMYRSNVRTVERPEAGDA